MDDSGRKTDYESQEFLGALGANRTLRILQLLKSWLRWSVALPELLNFCFSPSGSESRRMSRR
jgi:hypothetical protein